MVVDIKSRREAWLEGRASSSDNSAESKSWTKLWKVNVPPKIRVFLWRLAKQSLPMGDLLQHRHISTSSPCLLCGRIDSWCHSLLECPMARSVWALADEEVVEHMYATTEPNARSWLFNMMESLTSEHFIMVGVSLWAIWTARRKAIHEGEFQSPLSTHYFVKRFLEELSLILKPSSGVLVTPYRERSRGWIPPGEGLIKANVDAAVSRDKFTGSVAVVLRRGDVFYMGSSVVVFKGVFDPPTLEALACREALALATDVALSRLVIASDCKHVVLDIAEGTGGQYAAIIQEINIQRLDFQEVSYTFEGRSSNKEAYSLAHFALALDQGRHLWLLEPHDFMSIPIILNVGQ
jgi:hypothetical protein